MNVLFHIKKRIKNEFVVGFIKVDDNYIEEDEKFFNQYKETIDKYYNMAY